MYTENSASYLKSNSNIVPGHNIDLAIVTSPTQHKSFSHVAAKANVYTAAFPLPGMST